MGLRDRDRGVAQRQAPRVVGPDLVARRAVRLERGRHRRGAPLVVVAVGVGLPLVDPVGEVLLEPLGRVGQAERRERHLDAGRGAPVLPDLVGEHGVRVRDDVDVDRGTDRDRGHGRRRGAGRERRGGGRRRRRRRLRDGDGRHGGPVGRRRPHDQPLDLRDEPVELVAQAERVRGHHARTERATQNDEHEHDGERGSERRAAKADGGHRAAIRKWLTGASGKWIGWTVGRRSARAGCDAAIWRRGPAGQIVPAAAGSGPGRRGWVQEPARSATIDRPSRPGRQTGEPIPWTASSPTSESPARRPSRRPSAPPAGAR